MLQTKLHFQLPEDLKAELFIAELENTTALQVVSKQAFLREFYDSFDWRLFNAGLLCEFDYSKSISRLCLIDLHGAGVIVTADLPKVPEFADQFSDEMIKNKLASLLEMRALMSMASIPCQAYCVNVLNEEQKTTARLLIEDYESLPTRVRIQSIRGYDKAAKHLRQLFEHKLALNRVEESLLESALQLHGRKPKDYSSKLNIDLEPGMRADVACRTIYRTLSRTMRSNEGGTKDDIDSEFLHDFRVAVRRTRSGLSQLKNILPGRVTAQYKPFFAWLGQITGEARDLDVYLLNFPEYQRSLPADMRNSLDPLYRFLQRKQHKIYRELAAKLNSSDYVSGMRQWESYLNEPIAVTPDETNAALPIKQVADKRILRLYQRVLKQGEAITDDTPPEALHELRKTCKKLRYLMEFFQNLYPEKKIGKLIKALKNFQNILGDFQDYQVQEQTLKKFAEEMAEERTPAETFISMGILMQNLHQKREQARRHFAGSFAQFKKPANGVLFHALFANKE
ncbi:CHAD domain-containing protein [Methylomonas sp. MgM2]